MEGTSMGGLEGTGARLADGNIPTHNEEGGWGHERCQESIANWRVGYSEGYVDGSNDVERSSRTVG